jgi:hypothetical protein
MSLMWFIAQRGIFFLIFILSHPLVIFLSSNPLIQLRGESDLLNGFLDIWFGTTFVIASFGHEHGLENWLHCTIPSYQDR